MTRRGASALVGAVSLALAACSSGGITGAPSAQAILDARLDQGPENTCEAPGAERAIGSFGSNGGAPLPVPDGTESTGVVCRVHDVGDGSLALRAEAFVDGERWFFVEGPVPATYDRQANPEGIDAPGLRVALRATAAMAYAESGGCRLLYASEPEGASAGRAWATVTCPRAARGELEATDPSRSCVLTARFRFENCAL